ncbi:MAG: hypothetical protein RIR31_1734, partial [Bacteroidota bacterium]
MKQLVFFIGLFLMITAVCYSQHKSVVKSKQKIENKIKQYWFVLLTEGKNRTQDSATAAKIQEGHMANISRLYY